MKIHFVRQLLEVELPYDPVCPSVGRSDGRSVMISYGYFHFHAPFYYRSLFQFVRLGDIPSLGAIRPLLHPCDAIITNYGL